MKPPVLKNFLPWYDDANKLPKNLDPFIRKWLLDQLPYEIITSDDLIIDQRDVGEITTGQWSAYRESVPSPAFSHYFFEEEVDVMAFKLKFL